MSRTRRQWLAAALAAGATANAGSVLAGGTKLETRTFKSIGKIAIPDSGNADPYPSVIKVDGFKQATVHRVVVTLRKLTHPCMTDLDVMLVAPNGVAVLLMSDAGSTTSAHNLTLTFDAAANTVLPATPGVVSGAYRPNNVGDGDPFPAPAPQDITTDNLLAFKGGDPNGKWRLYVRDDADEDSGLIRRGWRLTITARVPK